MSGRNSSNESGGFFFLLALVIGGILVVAFFGPDPYNVHWDESIEFIRDPNHIAEEQGCSRENIVSAEFTDDPTHYPDNTCALILSGELFNEDVDIPQGGFAVIAGLEDDGDKFFAPINPPNGNEATINLESHSPTLEVNLLEEQILKADVTYIYYIIVFRDGNFDDVKLSFDQ